MKTKIKISLARILLPFVAIWLCWLPSQAYAALPAAAGVYAVSPSAIGAASNVIAGPWAGSAASAAGLTGAGAVALGVGVSALAVGTALGYLIVDNLTGGYSRIPLTAANPVPVPTGASVQTIPAHAEYQADMNPFGGALIWSSSFCDAYSQGLSLNTNITVNSVSCSDSTRTGTATYTNKQTGAVTSSPISAIDCITRAAPISCPVGSTLTNGLCVVDNPRTVYPDHSKDYSRSGTTLSPAAGDVDAGATVTTLPSGGLLVQDLTANGEARHYKIIPQVDGGSSLEIYEPVTNAVGDTGTKKVVVTVSPDGTITGKTQTTTGEQLGQDAAGQPVLNPAPVGTTFTPSSPSGSTITFPNDYARAGEAAQAAQSSNTKLDTLHNDLSATTIVADPSVPVAGDMPTWGDTFTNLLSWQLPAHSSTCPTPSMDVSPVFGSGHILTMDSHCALMADNALIISSAMLVTYTLLALFLVMKA